MIPDQKETTHHTETNETKDHDQLKGDLDHTNV